MRLKEQYLDAIIYIPLDKTHVVGRFIDEKLYPYLNERYPDLFEVEKIEKIEKKVKKNADSEQTDSE